MRILAIGDVVGKNGTDFVRSILPSYKREKGIDICIVNGENSYDDNGITPASADSLFVSGADVITTGNHVYRRREIYNYLDEHEFLLRPANFSKSNPGKGYAIVDKGRVRVGVVNLMGTAYMDSLENPFHVIEKVLKELDDCKVIIVDFHAEATSEKRALGLMLDGRVSAVFGTHTHVQTADEQILPGGTGYITDIGMTGPINSVLGVNPEIIIKKFKDNMPAKFENADGPSMMNGCIFDIDEKTGKTVSIERVLIKGE